MRDYAELIKDLRESAEWSDRLAVLMSRDVGDSKAPLMRKAADAIEELVSTAEHYRIGADDWFKEACDYKEKLAKCEEELQQLKMSDTIYGYPVEQLIAFAIACRRNGVEEKDLKTFSNNAEFAYRAIEAETMAAFERAVLGKWKGRSD